MVWGIVEWSVAWLPRLEKNHWDNTFPISAWICYVSKRVTGTKLDAPWEDRVILIGKVFKGLEFLGTFDIDETLFASPQISNATL